MGAFVMVGGIDAGADEADADVAASAPECFAIGAVIGVNVGDVTQIVGCGQCFQFAAEAHVVGASRIFGANGDAVFVGFLLGSDDGHVDGEQIGHIGGEAGGRAVADFFVVADVDGGGLFGL